MTFAVETQQLRYQAGKNFALTDVNLRVPVGSIYGFLGPNGAGKTTTIRLLLGLLRAEGGTITVLGESMPAAYVTVLGRVGYVPDRPHVHPSLTVGESMELHAAFYMRWDARWAGELQRQFRLVDDRRVGSLSKGETGKLMMLLALAQQPELLVLDEPTDGLDPVVRRDVLEAVLGYVSDRQASVLISSHLVHELERICDWIGVMDRGDLMAELPMRDFKNGIKRLYVTGAPELVGETPFTILSRAPMNGSAEQWLVRGWEPEMRGHVESIGAVVTDVIDLDLEDGFVELLRSFRDKR
ncbi:MAG TPA: ABC transporter ATP-binding protein [Gemmatimonadaceae bacterium]